MKCKAPLGLRKCDRRKCYIKWPSFISVHFDDICGNHQGPREVNAKNPQFLCLVLLPCYLLPVFSTLTRVLPSHFFIMSIQNFETSVLMQRTIYVVYVMLVSIVHFSQQRAHSQLGPGVTCECLYLKREESVGILQQFAVQSLWQDQTVARGLLMFSCELC